VRRDISVGILIISVILVLSYMVSRLAQERELGGPTKNYFTLVDDSIGLLPGSSVKVAGIDIGRLLSKSLQNRQAKLTLEIVSSVDVHKDASIQLQSVGYLGDRYLKLNPGSDTEPLVPAGALIPAQSSVTMNKLMDDSEKLLESWTEVARSLRILVGN